MLLVMAQTQTQKCGAGLKQRPASLGSLDPHPSAVVQTSIPPLIARRQSILSSSERRLQRLMRIRPRITAHMVRQAAHRQPDGATNDWRRPGRRKHRIRLKIQKFSKAQTQKQSKTKDSSHQSMPSPRAGKTKRIGSAVGMMQISDHCPRTMSEWRHVFYNRTKLLQAGGNQHHRSSRVHAAATHR